MSGAEQAARAIYNAVGGRYPAVEQAAPVAPAPAPVVAPAQPTVVSPEASRGDDLAAAAREAEEHAAALYAPVTTRGSVDWNEAPAQAAEYNFDAPPMVLDRSEAGQAAMARLRDGLAEAGAGRTVARELFADAVRAHQAGQPVASREAGEAELRRHFGDRYDAQIAAARGLVQRAARRCPEIVPFLERTGLGNEPTFIRKLAAAAGRRSRS